MSYETDVLERETVSTDRLPDVQSAGEPSNIAIDDAGVCGVRLPFSVTDVDGSAWHTVVDAATGVGVAAGVRGTHMSRFISFLEELRADGVRLDRMPSLLECLLPRMESNSGSLDIRFKCFLRKEAPVSGMRGLLDVEAGYRIVRTPSEGVSMLQWLRVPIMTLCPCSKAIAAYGAHNQRTIVTVTLKGLEHEPWPVTQVATWIESCASSPLYPVLKRADEKYVTERSFETPRFVEDVARDVHALAGSVVTPGNAAVRVESQESIHNHQAYAVIGYDAMPAEWRHP